MPGGGRRRTVPGERYRSRERNWVLGPVCRPGDTPRCCAMETAFPRRDALDGNRADLRVRPYEANSLGEIEKC